MNSPSWALPLAAGAAFGFSFGDKLLTSIDQSRTALFLWIAEAWWQVTSHQTGPKWHGCLLRAVTLQPATATVSQ